MSQTTLPKGEPAPKFFILTALFLAALIPGWLMSGLIGEREERQAEVARSFTANWGPEQSLTTPLLVIPFEVGPNEPRRFFKIAADKVTLTAKLSAEDRHRGLFRASVFESAVRMRGTMHIPQLTEALPDHARVLWQESFILLGVSNRSGMKDGDRLVWNGKAAPFQNCREVIVSADAECPNAGDKLMARLPDTALLPDSDIPFEVLVDLRGTSSFSLASSSRQFDMSAAGNWTTPGFEGSLLPVSSQVSQNGFEASWQAVDYGAARLWTANHIDNGPSLSIVKVELLEAVPIYRMIHRASKYHALFLALCFATYLLFEVLSGIRIHVVQYGLMALSLSLFPLLLLSLAEPLGYGAGFLGSALLVLLQASLYTASVTRRIREASLFGGMLATLFGFLYVLLGLETYSLLVGSLALFLLLSSLMALTSLIDWSKWSIGGESS